MRSSFPTKEGKVSYSVWMGGLTSGEPSLPLPISLMAVVPNTVITTIPSHPAIARLVNRVNSVLKGGLCRPFLSVDHYPHIYCIFSSSPLLLLILGVRRSLL